MRTSLLLLGLMAILVIFSSSAGAWTHKYECDYLPVEQGWRMRSGSVDWMSIWIDPEDATNKLLLLASPCFPDPWPEELPNVDFNRPQLRLESLPDIWVALTDVGLTFEIRFKQTAGGLYAEAYDGACKFWFWANSEFEGSVPAIVLADVGQYGDANGEYPGPLANFSEWTVFRGTQIQNTDGTYSMYAYVDGEELFALDDIDPVLKPMRPGANTFRWGHGGGSGPKEGEFAEIWVDYIYLDTGGMYPPGTPTTGETAVQQESWGRIKCQF